MQHCGSHIWMVVGVQERHFTHGCPDMTSLVQHLTSSNESSAIDWSLNLVFLGWKKRDRPHADSVCLPESRYLLKRSKAGRTEKLMAGEAVLMVSWQIKHAKVNGTYAGWWFGTWLLWLSIYCECHHPNWLIFFRGVGIPPTRYN